MSILVVRHIVRNGNVFCEHRPIIVYTLVARRSGTNKSASLELTKNLVRNITEPLFDTQELLRMYSLNSRQKMDRLYVSQMNSLVFLTAWTKILPEIVTVCVTLHCSSSKSKRIKVGNLELKNPPFIFCSFIQNYTLAQSMTNANHCEAMQNRRKFETIVLPYDKFVENKKIATETSATNEIQYRLVQNASDRG